MIDFKKNRSAEEQDDKKENGYYVKIIKKPKYFILGFPDGKEALVKANGWDELNSFVNYFKDEYEEDLVFISINRWEAFKFFLKGKLFDADK